MKKQRGFSESAWFLITLFACIAVLIWAYDHDKAIEDNCTAKGGIAVISGDDFVCIKAEAVIK